MNHIIAIAKKELRGYFLSPIALIFLGSFLVATVATFFVLEGFFARGIADVRPMFEWMPVFLLFLCAALTMQLWSEEQKMGTLEILMTLPVKKHELVLGKFLASWALTALALALTLAIPITVSMLGDLDWGPVVGGYLAALLLAAAYLAIGLFVSSLTGNQIVALIITVLVSGYFYLLGHDTVTSLFGNRIAEFLASIGTGSRFESVLRGVIDIRDLIYYGGLTASFLVLNTLVVSSKGWSKGPRAAAKRKNAVVGVLLAIANILVLNVLVSGVTGLRVDLTERGEYSISNVTEDVVKGLDEPLLIRGYFSGKTHPLLAPLVPNIRDLIAEYEEIAPGKVRAEYVDPREDEELEKEANELYGIKSFPFKIQDRLDQAVVNSYFSILVKYGDEYEVLNFGDLIEVQPRGPAEVDVKLRNLEYDLTRTIKKVASGFQTVEAVFVDLPAPAEFTVFASKEGLPANFTEATGKLESVLKKLKESSNGKFTYEIIDPDAEGATVTRESLYKTYGFRPFAVSLLDEGTFYFHWLLKVGDRYERILPPDSMSEADIEKDILSAIKRAAPGFLKTIAIAKPKREPPQMPPGYQGRPPPPPPEVTRAISKQLEEGYTVKDADLSTGKVPGDVDVLLVFAPEAYDDKQRFAIDQFLMRGGAVVLLAGRYQLDPSGGQNVQVKKVDTGLTEMLASYGLKLGDAMVLDEQNEGIPMPVEREVRGLRIREMQYLRYPYFVDVRSNQMDESSVVVAGLPAVTLPWAVAVERTAEASSEDGDKAEGGVTYTTLMSSSDKAWLSSETKVQPDFQAHPDTGFAPVAEDTERGEHPLAVLVSGKLESAFKGKEDPTGANSILQTAPASARLVVIGSSSFANDMVLGLTRQAGSNLQLVQNLVDWGVADVDLLTIRSRGTFARTLIPLETKDRLVYEVANYAWVVAALFLVVVLTIGRRRRKQAFDLDESARPHRSSPKTVGAES